MKFSIILYVIFSSLFALSVATLNFKKCFSKDLSCLKDAIQDALLKLKDGIDDLGVPPLDPLLVPKIRLESGNIVNLPQNYDNSLWYGFSSAVIRNLSFDINKGKLFLEVVASQAGMNSSYTAKGKIMILDINGHGKAWIGLERLKGKVELNMENYTKNGNKFFRVRNIIPELQAGHCAYHFENIFDGNQQLSDNINQVLNDNWREIFDEQRAGFLKAIGASLLNLINKLFAEIPIHTMFLD